MFALFICRKDTKTIFLRNSTLLPVAWRVNGMDNLGDDFSLTTEHGVIDAKSEFALQMHFRAVRPTNIKKIVRLEVRVYPCYMCITETASQKLDLTLKPTSLYPTINRLIWLDSLNSGILFTTTPASFNKWRAH